MHKQNRKFQLLNGLIAIVALAFAVGCRGFFVNPTLSTLTVGPTTPTFQQGSTLQMAATGTFNDGTTQDLTSKAFWSTSDSTIASINTTGLVTGVSPGQATITAASGTVSGSTTITIALANITSIAVTPTSSTKTEGSTQQYKAVATLAGGTTQDITSSVTWATSNPSAGTIDSSGLFTTVTTGIPPDQTTTITATSGLITGQATLTVD